MASSRTFSSSPLMFESDDEDTPLDEHTRESNIENGEEKHAETSVPVQVDEPKKEDRLLKRFQTVLMGIPPPPAFTVPQLDVREILMLWRDNQKYRVVLSPGKDRKDEAALLEDKVKSTKWPEALGVDHWDIYYNRSSACEEMERLSMRYRDRYVGAETSSCVNALFAKSPSRTASARKRARTRAWGHSPGRRLSHLARRRKAFTYCSVAGNNNPDKKMIMVEIKKMSNRQKKRNSAKKTKPTPKKKSQLQLNTHKRALFQSPDQLPAANERKTPNFQCVQRSKRNLFIETSSEKVNENGKRERTPVKKVSPRKRVNRSLSFQDNTPIPKDRKEVPVLPSTTQASKTILSGVHKQKLLWAVTNALREKAMGMTHELFRPCMSVLFKACQKLWLTKVARLAQEGSTSDNMLAMAKQFTTYTIDQISQDPTAEHMAMVCGNIIRIAENQYKTSEKTAVGGNTGDKLKSTKSSPIRPNENNEQVGSDVEKVCSFKEDLVISRGTDSRPTSNDKNSSKDSELNSTEEKVQNDDLPSKLNSPTKIKFSTSKKVGTPLGRHLGRSDEPSKIEESTLAMNSNWICTPSNHVLKDNTPNKNSPNAISRVTRRNSNGLGLMALNVTSGDVEIQFSEPAVENIKRKDEDTTKLQSLYRSPRLFKKSSPDKRKKSQNAKRRLCVNEAESLSLSPQSPHFVETNHILTSVTEKLVSPGKFPDNALQTNTTLITNVCTLNNESESCISSPTNNQPINSVLCKPLARRSISKDSPIKSLAVNENDNVKSNFVNNKTDDSKKPKRRQSKTSATSQLSPQKNNLIESIESSRYVDLNETEKCISQECTDTNLERRQDFEKNKENIEIQIEANSCYSDRKFEVDNSCTNLVKRLPILTAVSTSQTVNRTLQLYNLSKNWRHDVEPPLLVSHWEQEPQQQEARCTDSPPLLVPHWEQTDSGGTNSLPESIMAHWQQLSGNACTSDKIMFDFEDTSYEIKFSPNNEDSTASSSCAPFEFPHLIDESKSGFNTVYRRNSSESCE